MQRIITFFLLILTTQFVNAQSFKDFKWLQGTWERQDTKPGSTAVESWEKMTNLGFQGLGVTMKGPDTVFVEKLSIVEKGNAFYYVAEVSHNPEPTYFKITSSSKTGFVCEKPDHDFPKKIEYQFKGDLLTVVISGDGKEIPFKFKKSQK